MKILIYKPSEFSDYRIIVIVSFILCRFECLANGTISYRNDIGEVMLTEVSWSAGVYIYKAPDMIGHIDILKSTKPYF